MAIQLVLSNHLAAANLSFQSRAHGRLSPSRMYFALHLAHPVAVQVQVPFPVLESKGFFAAATLTYFGIFGLDWDTFDPAFALLTYDWSCCRRAQLRC